MRIKLSKQGSDIVDNLTSLYRFPSDGIIARIAVAYTIQQNKYFSDTESYNASSDGKDWRDDRQLFGVSPGEVAYTKLYKAVFDQHYRRSLGEDEFSKLLKQHLEFGLKTIDEKISNHPHNYIAFLMEIVKRGIDLTRSSTVTSKVSRSKYLSAFDSLLTLTLGTDEKGNSIDLKINDLTEFDSCNIAVAGMVGSGKTELIKDLLFQLSIQSNHQLKFIFFDYKGEGNPDRLSWFLQSTKCEMVDLKTKAFELNPLSFIDLEDERTKGFNIKSFVDFVCTIATDLGIKQKHVLQTVISNCFDEKETLRALMPETYKASWPTLTDVYDSLEIYYSEQGLPPDALLAIMNDLAKSIFSETNEETRIYEKNLYVNLPLELSDTLRQLCVFLTLKYLLAEFSSTNDTEPTEERIKPMRYVIVIDEAHVYLKNKNASKALEEILRMLRSKGVIAILLTQGVEDYKTKNFDFSSQIKIPICLNINNKDYRLIESFVGTPRSKQKLQESINKLQPQKGLINISEPTIITLNQFWQRQKPKN